MNIKSISAGDKVEVNPYARDVERDGLIGEVTHRYPLFVSVRYERSDRTELVRIEDISRRIWPEPTTYGRGK